MRMILQAAIPLFNYVFVKYKNDLDADKLRLNQSNKFKI